MNHLVSKLRDFGIRHRFIPKTREKVEDDFAYVDSEIRDIAYQVKNEIEDYFTKKEGVVPFHWHDIRLKIRSMPCHLEYAVDWGKKVLKNIRGYLGYYARDDKDVYINQYLLDSNKPELLKATIKHELMHTVQDEVGTLETEPMWKYEAEASMFSVDNFEDTDFYMTNKFYGYRRWTLDYIQQFGKRLMTSFKHRLWKLRKYFTEEELKRI
jgi:hypothetical protein